MLMGTTHSLDPLAICYVLLFSNFFGECGTDLIANLGVSKRNLRLQAIPIANVRNSISDSCDFSFVNQIVS